MQSAAKEPRVLRALVHRLAVMQTPFNAQDAILSVRALYGLRVYAPRDVQSVCEKAAFSLVAAPRHEVEPAVVIDTVNSMLALHTTALSSSTSAGATLQKRLCQRFLDLDPNATPNQTLQKACVVLMKLYLPRTDVIPDTRVANYVLRLVHNRLEALVRKNRLQEDPILCLAYIALFPYTSMCTAQIFCRPHTLERESMKTLLVCAELLVRHSDPALAERRGVDALQALHLAPALALVEVWRSKHESRGDNEVTSSPPVSSPSSLLERWSQVRSHYVPHRIARHVRRADAVLFLCRFAGELAADAALLRDITRLSGTASSTSLDELNAADMSKLLSAVTRAASSRSRASSSIPAPGEVASSASAADELPRLVRRVLSFVETHFLHTTTNGTTASTRDCAVLIANCWQAVRAASPFPDEACFAELQKVTTQEACQAALVSLPDALYTVILSVGATYDKSHPADAAVFVPPQRQLVRVATQLWSSWWSEGSRSAAHVDAAFLLAACSSLATDVQCSRRNATQHGVDRGEGAKGRASQHVDTPLPSEELWRAVSQVLADHGASREKTHQWLRSFRRTREVRVLLDALNKVLRLRHDDADGFDAVVQRTPLTVLCRLGAIAISSSLGGQKLSSESPWLPIQFLRLATANQLLLGTEARSAYRVCTVALTKHRELSIADMIKVLAALIGTDLHASTSEDPVGTTRQRLSMDRDALWVLNTVCAHHGLYEDASSFRRRCPSVRYLCRCAEAARRCGAVLALESNASEDDALALVRPTLSAVGLLDTAVFVVDIVFLTQTEMRGCLSPTDAAHMLRLISETAPFSSRTSTGRYHHEQDGDVRGVGTDRAVDDEPLERLKPAADILVSLALTTDVTEKGSESSENYWRLLYLLNANRWPSQDFCPLFSAGALVRLAESLIQFWEAALQPSTAPQTHRQGQVRLKQAGALASALLDSCVLTRLQGNDEILERVRQSLQHLQKVLVLSPNGQDQQTALKLNIIL